MRDAVGADLKTSIAPWISVRGGERAVDAGARVISPVGEGQGWRVGRIVDPFGHHWEIGRELAIS